MWRDYGSKAHWAELHPRLYYPIQMLKVLEFEPSFGLLGSVWKVEQDGNEPSEEDDGFLHREGLDFRADLSTELAGVFSIDGQRVKAIRHTVRPQVVYEYLTTEDHGNRPDFEDYDLLEDRNMITYSLTNFFTMKSMREQGPDTGPPSTEGGQVPDHRFDDFCRIKVSQSYEIKKNRRFYEDDRPKRSFSDIKGEVEFKYGWVDLDGDVGWSPYDYKFKSYSADLEVLDWRGDRASVDYRYTNGFGRSILTKFFVKLFDPVSVTWELERNIKAGKIIKTGYGIRYEPQCWSLGVTYTDDRSIDEQKVLIEVGLHGLGKVEF
jgi:LPS-assembly protein